MRNLNVYISGGGRVVDLDEPIIGPTTMKLRHATVFWNYRNVTADNGTVVYGSVPPTKTVTLAPGYWDFESIRNRLDYDNIVLSRNIPDRTCNVLSTGKSVNLKNLGLMLGFDKDKVIPADTEIKSDRPVDILRGLRYINVKCDAVDIRESTDSEGGRSTILASLPIVTYESLNSSATNYFDIDSVVDTCSGNISSLRFSIDSNVTNPVDVDVLLNIVVDRVASGSAG